jgi:Swiss Army Knife RNA repair-like protein
MIKLDKNITFLDIDGVIATSRSLWKAFAKDLEIDVEESDFSDYTHCTDGINPILMKEIDKRIKSKKYPFPNYFNNRWPYDNICIDYLNRIIEENNADICVISSRRIGLSMEDLDKILKDKGVKGNVVGRTPKLETRALEIIDWLDKASEKYNINSICIIDDESYYDIDYILYDYTIDNIDINELGLKEEHIEEAKRIFSLDVDVNNLLLISTQIEEHSKCTNSKHK